MSEAELNFNEFSEDDERHGLAKEAKTLLQPGKVREAYQSRESPYYGFPAERFYYLKGLNEEAFVLHCKENFLDDLKLSKESERREETNKLLMKSEKSSSSLIHPILDSNLNANPNQEIHIIKTSAIKLETPSPRKNAVQYSPRTDAVQYIPRKEAVQYSPRKDAVQYSPRKDAVQYSQRKDAVQCSQRKDAVQCSQRKDAVQCSPKKDAVQCSPKKNAVQCRPRKDAEIETDISNLSTENSNPTISFISLTYLKRGKATTDYTDQKKFLKETFCENKSDPRTLTEVCPSAKSTATCSPKVPENTICSNSHTFTENEKDHLSNEFPNKNCPEITCSSGLENVDSKMLLHCITQFQNLLSMRDNCLEHIYNALCNLKNSLQFLSHHMQTMVRFLYNMSGLKGDYVSEKLLMYIFDTICIASLSVITMGTLKREVLKHVQFWILNFGRIRKINSHYLPLQSNGEPLVSFETLHEYEKCLKSIWIFLDKEIDLAESMRLNFLRTQKDVVKFINMFAKCLVTVGILKP